MNVPIKVLQLREKAKNLAIIPTSMRQATAVAEQFGNSQHRSRMSPAADKLVC